MRVRGAILLCAVAWALGGAMCSERPMTGTKGCARQTDCAGGEACDEGVCVAGSGGSSGTGSSGSSGASSSGDAGPAQCTATSTGCTDDALANRAPDCATPVFGNTLYREDLVGCAATTDHFAVDIPQGGGFQALAWPNLATNVTLSMAASGAEPAIGEAGTTTVANSLAMIDGAAMAAGSRVIAVSSAQTAGYALMVRAGGACTVDEDCGVATRRCLPLFHDPGAVTGLPATAFGRGGICVDDADSPCGDGATPANARRTATPVRVSALDAGFETYAAGPFTEGTCIADEDWWRLAPDFPAFHLKVTLSCTSVDPAFRPLLVVVNAAGDLEWQVLFTPIPDTSPWPSGTSFVRSIGYLPGGAMAGANAAHYVMLRQVSGRMGGTCSMNMEVTPDNCVADTSCTGRENPKMLRTTCTAGACYRAP